MATKEEILESIANMSVMEVADLIKMMEEKFGVVAAAAAAGPAAAAEAAGKSPPNSTLSLSLVILPRRSRLLKEVRSLTGLGLKAKDLVEQETLSSKKA